MSDPTAGAEPEPERGGAHTYAGPITFAYEPEPDREADPGEIVWSWVAFEEDATIGKDRPIAVVGHTDDRRLVALMLSSQDHRGDRGWTSIGTGPWDKQGRESWVRVDRVLAVHANAVRREGAVMSRQVYESLVTSMGGVVTQPTTARRGLLSRMLGLLRRPSASNR